MGRRGRQTGSLAVFRWGQGTEDLGHADRAEADNQHQPGSYQVVTSSGSAAWPRSLQRKVGLRQLRVGASTSSACIASRGVLPQACTCWQGTDYPRRSSSELQAAETRELCCPAQRASCTQRTARLGARIHHSIHVTARMDHLVAYDGGHTYNLSRSRHGIAIDPSEHRPLPATCHSVA